AWLSFLGASRRRVGQLQLVRAALQRALGYPVVVVAPALPEVAAPEGLAVEGGRYAERSDAPRGVSQEPQFVFDGLWLDHQREHAAQRRAPSRASIAVGLVRVEPAHQVRPRAERPDV